MPILPCFFIRLDTDRWINAGQIARLEDDGTKLVIWFADGKETYQGANRTKLLTALSNFPHLD